MSKAQWKKDIEKGKLTDGIPESIYEKYIYSVCEDYQDCVALDELEEIGEWLETVAIPEQQESLEHTDPLNRRDHENFFNFLYGRKQDLHTVRMLIKTRKGEGK